MKHADHCKISYLSVTLQHLVDKLQRESLLRNRGENYLSITLQLLVHLLQSA